MTEDMITITKNLYYELLECKNRCEDIDKYFEPYLEEEDEQYRIEQEMINLNQAYEISELQKEYSFDYEDDSKEIWE